MSEFVRYFVDGVEVEPSAALGQLYRWAAYAGWGSTAEVVDRALSELVDDSYTDMSGTALEVVWPEAFSREERIECAVLMASTAHAVA